MKTAVEIVGVSIFCALYGGIGILSSIYVLDFIHELVADFRYILILQAILGALILALNGGAITGMEAAIKKSTGTVNLAIMALSPLGLVAGFLVWQFENWLCYGVFDIDPWLYNGIFRHIGLAV